jgi:hypothetical protein
MQRSAKRYKSSASKAKQARAIGAKLSAQFPTSQYGKMYSQRYTQAGIDHFGATAKTANEAQTYNRKSTGYTGHGGYFTDVAKDMSTAYKTVMPRSWRKAVVKTGMKYAGSGGYNMLVNPTVHSAVIQRGDETQSITITNREYIGDLMCPGTTQEASAPAFGFSNTGYSINPGLQNVFPWLSQLAANYDEYKFDQLVFEYHPTISETSTSINGQPGQVMLCTNYNASAPLFSDKESMVQYHGGQSDRLTEMCVHGVECDPAKVSNQKRYVRTSPVIVGQDLKTYDLGTFQLAFTNVPWPYQGSTAGELWVYYTVTLMVPKLGVNRGNLIQTDIFLQDVPPSATVGTQIPILNMFSSSPQPLYLSGQQNNIGSSVYNLSGGSTMIFQVRLPPSLNGSFQLMFRLQGLSLASTGAAVAPSSLFGRAVVEYAGTCTGVNDIYADGDVEQGVPGNYTSTNGSGTVASNTTVVVAHFNVKSANSNVNNAVQITIGSANAVNLYCFQSGYISVTERNPGFQTSNTIQQPTWVNASGMVIPTVYG